MHDADKILDPEIKTGRLFSFDRKTFTWISDDGEEQVIPKELQEGQLRLKSNFGFTTEDFK